MTDDDIRDYRLQELEMRITRIEKFIFGIVASTALFALTLIWMISDLPSRLSRIEHGQVK